MDALGELLSKKDVCRLVNRAPATLDRWEKDGKFPRRRVPPNAKPVRDSKTGKVLRSHNCRVYYPKAEVLDWLKKLAQLPIRDEDH